MTASLGSNSNDTQLVYDDIESASLSTTSLALDDDDHNDNDGNESALDQTRPSFFEHHSILFPKSKLIDYLSVHNSNNNQQQQMLVPGINGGNGDDTTLAAITEPKKESKKEKKLVRAIGGSGDANDVIRLTLMSLELHANSRANLTPNPDTDRIAFACYSVYEFKSDQVDSNDIDTHLIVVLDPTNIKSSLSARKRLI